MKRLVILKYHNIAREAILAGLSEEQALREFFSILGSLSRKFEIVSLKDALDPSRSGVKEPLALTFDDSYSWYADVLSPRLAASGYGATFFISSGNVMSRSLMWNDRVFQCLYLNPYVDSLVCTRTFGFSCFEAAQSLGEASFVDWIVGQLKYIAAEKRDLLVDFIDREVSGTDQDVHRTLSNVIQPIDEPGCRKLIDQGMEIGGHTLSHSILAVEDSAEAYRQIYDDRKFLEQVTGESIVSFAFPNGRFELDYRLEHIDLLERAGYRYAVSTDYGISSPTKPYIYRLRRFEVPWNASRFARLRLELKALFGNASA